MLKIFGRLTGAQITVIAVALIAALVPGSLYAVAAFTNVAIQDPVSGYRARVTSAGQVSVGPANSYQNYVAAYDYFKHLPAYKVTIQFVADSNKVIYTVPSGYDFMLEALTGTVSYNSGVTGGGFFLVGSSHGGIASAFVANTAYASVSQTFGSGTRLYPGETLSVDSRSGGNTGLYIHGRLIPTSFSTASAEAPLPAPPPAAATYFNAVPKNHPKTRESPP